MSALGFVPDGFTITGAWINEVPFLYPRIQFDFRRMTNEEFADYLHTISTWTEKQAQRLIATHLANRISSWDYKDTKGQAVNISEEIMQDLSPRLSKRLWNIVAGLEGPDGVAGQEKSDADAEFNAALQAARSGRALQQVREEAELKNS